MAEKPKPTTELGFRVSLQGKMEMAGDLKGVKAGLWSKRWVLPRSQLWPTHAYTAFKTVEIITSTGTEHNCSCFQMLKDTCKVYDLRSLMNYY